MKTQGEAERVDDRRKGAEAEADDRKGAQGTEGGPPTPSAGATVSSAAAASGRATRPNRHRAAGSDRS